MLTHTIPDSKNNIPTRYSIKTSASAMISVQKQYISGRRAGPVRGAVRGAVRDAVRGHSERCRCSERWKKLEKILVFYWNAFECEHYCTCGQFPTKTCSVKKVDCMFFMKIPVKLKHQNLCSFFNVNNSQYFETWCTLIDCMYLVKWKQVLFQGSRGSLKSLKMS